MRRFAVLYFVTMLVGVPFARAQEIPPRVREVSTSIMMLCTKVEMRGRFHSISARGVHTDARDIEKVESCGNAFQISKERVLSVAHVEKDLHIMLAEYFVQKLAILQVHGFHAGHTPELVDKVTLTRTLVASDGHVFVGRPEEHRASWSGEMGQETVKKFLASLVRVPDASPYPKSTLEIIATDTSRDLVLLSISPSHELRAYVSVTSKTPAIGELAWGVAATMARNGNEALDTIITAGRVQEWLDNETAPRHSIRISMKQPTKGGYSGGFAVDAHGDLIGVTHASSALEHTWNFDLPHPCSESLPCTRTVVSAWSVRDFLRLQGR